ncbi:unnamed protein product [Pieris macdunnoughi]|uniref:Uncharacterized protein n=1 Tax=Pieris macdunnoughi TaxID=345717 RepID=A0A821PZ90_9NEOP|nr:unnamed protein product [Pieris macdunnoughi]
MRASSTPALGARRQKTDLHVAEPSRSASPASSLRSQRAKQYRASLPVRSARLLQRSRTQTPSDGASDGSTSPAPAPSTLLQDVVDIKTLLLQLKRVLQEPGEEHHTMSSQLEERDRLVRVLQQQMLRMAESHDARPDDTCNVATQTDRLRPPMGTTLTSSENSGLVSWNEQGNGRKLPSYSEAQKTKRPVTNGVVKCQCGARKVNGLDDTQTDRLDTVHLKPNSRVGTKYLQAVTNTENRRYIKRDSSLSEKSDRKNLYTNRSRSIENFQNQNYSTVELKPTVIEETGIKHHTSYSDLYNGRISSRESVNRHSPSLNGQSTDTDYSSDGGYKSLPSSINYGSPKKVSGIPRRSLEQKFISTKQVRASAV